MPPMSSKNAMLTGSAATDLGMGSLTQQELEDEELQRKKKLMQSQTQGLNSMGPATQSLYGYSGQ